MIFRYLLSSVRRPHLGDFSLKRLLIPVGLAVAKALEERGGPRDVRK